MYVDTSSIHKHNKTYTRYLLRESFRENGKVKHRTLANISHCSPQEIEALRLALRHKHDLVNLGSLKDSVTLQQGPSVGALWTVYQVEKQLGLDQVLGADRQGQLALWQVMARVIDQGSRLSAVRLATAHAAGEVLGLAPFDEDDLYENLDWLSEHQAEIEQRWFHRQPSVGSEGLFLYDVTSTYMEGEQNELAAFGYNRDGKRGKRQVVIGLLCNAQGTPLSIECFAGNTQDPKTFASQVKKVAERFGGGGAVTFVGDRGMIKSAQIETLGDAHCRYITAITKPQIETLLRQGILQMSLFDQSLAEVTADNGLRYILRRNPIRAEEIAATRTSKYEKPLKAVADRNAYLASHPRARVEVALRGLTQESQKLSIAHWVRLSLEGRVLRLIQDQDQLHEIERLDGCYVLKTDLSKQVATKEVIHDRYKDLALVEWAFRTSKSVQLEMRPVYVRRESRTRGHALVVMLAYCIVKELAARWRDMDMTVQEGLDQLAMLCVTEVRVKNQVPYCEIPMPREMLSRLLSAAQVHLPKVLSGKRASVTTKTKLQKRRKRK